MRKKTRTECLPGRSTFTEGFPGLGSTGWVERVGVADMGLGWESYAKQQQHSSGVGQKGSDEHI